MFKRIRLWFLVFGGFVRFGYGGGYGSGGVGGVKNFWVMGGY